MLEGNPHAIVPTIVRALEELERNAQTQSSSSGSPVAPEEGTVLETQTQTQTQSESSLELEQSVLRAGAAAALRPLETFALGNLESDTRHALELALVLEATRASLKVATLEAISSRAREVLEDARNEPEELLESAQSYLRDVESIARDIAERARSAHNYGPSLERLELARYVGDIEEIFSSTEELASETESAQEHARNALEALELLSYAGDLLEQDERLEELRELALALRVSPEEIGDVLERAISRFVP